MSASDIITEGIEVEPPITEDEWDDFKQEYDQKHGRRPILSPFDEGHVLSTDGDFVRGYLIEDELKAIAEYFSGRTFDGYIEIEWGEEDGPLGKYARYTINDGRVLVSMPQTIIYSDFEPI